MQRPLSRYRALMVAACTLCLAWACAANSAGTLSNADAARAIASTHFQFPSPFQQTGMPECGIVANQPYEMSCQVNLVNPQNRSNQQYDAILRIYFFAKPGGLDLIRGYIKSNLLTQANQTIFTNDYSGHLTSKDGRTKAEFPTICKQAYPPKTNAICTAAESDSIVVAASVMPSPSDDAGADSATADSLLISGLMHIFILTHPQLSG